MDSCVILAGGLSSRFGSNKAFAKFGGKNLIDFMCDKYSKIFNNVYVSLKDCNVKTDYPVIYDKIAKHSPLIAIYSALDYLKKDVFITALDIPLLQESSVLKMSKIDGEIVVAKSSYKYHMCGFFKETILPKLENLIDRDIGKFGLLLECCDTKFCEIDEKELVNLNYFSDYIKVLNE